MTRTNLFTRVYRQVRQIPKGKVATYGAIAKAIGTKDARLVGFALHANRDNKTPCHRVVDRTGRVSESFAFGGYKEQKLRLEAEGVCFKDEEHVDLERYFFDFG